MRRLLDCIYGLLLSPQIDDPLNSNLALLYYVSTNATHLSLRCGSASVLTSVFCCLACVCRREMEPTKRASRLR